MNLTPYNCGKCGKFISYEQVGKYWDVVDSPICPKCERNPKL